ncbi:MAG TPA: hypothetical protein VGH30_04770 [Jatrophihabitantaceae bacterium]
MSFSLGHRPAALVLLALIAQICGCTSSRSGGSATSAPATRHGSSPPSAAVTGRLPALTRADSKQITRAFVTFFDGKTSAANAATVLQNGPKFAAALRAQAGSQQAKSLTAKVAGISRDPQHPSPHVAKVTFSLLSGGQILLPDSPGLAVESGGRWQVAAQTFCALLQLQGSPPKQCSDPSLTAVPTG